MAIGLGNNYRLWIESVTPGTYNILKGQQSLSYGRTANTIDISTKDNSPYAAAAPGLFDLSVTLDGIADLPDTTGFTRLETQFKAQTATKFQIRRAGASGATPTDVVLEGTFFALDLSIDYAQNDAVKYKLALSAASAPTIDALLI
jgi:predicted secreted protein